MVGRALVACVALLGGCGGVATPITDATTGELGPTSTSSEPSTADPSGPVSAAGSSSTADPSDTTGDDTKFDVPPLDVPPHVIETCDASATEQVDLEVVTPTGTFVAAHAWWAWEACCIVDPWLVLAESPTLEVVDGAITTPHVTVFAPGAWGPTAPYLGPYEVALQDVGNDGHDGFTDPVAGFELLAPLDPSTWPDTPPADLVASFAVDAAGWTITGTVAASYCAAIEGPPCPCE